MTKDSRTSLKPVNISYMQNKLRLFSPTTGEGEELSHVNIWLN